MTGAHIALLMMLKNEHKCLPHTLSTVVGHVDSLVVFDTGSTDDTVAMLKRFSQDHGVQLRLKEGEFVDFATSRNVSLDFADTFDDIDFLLLLDCNDELRGGELLRGFCESHKHGPSTAFLVCQEWWSGRCDRYYNLRMVKPRRGWRYRGRVHEWMVNVHSGDGETPCEGDGAVVRVPDGVVLYQDRTRDDGKTSARFARDKAILLADHENDPGDPRTAFYLAQTYSCLGDLDEALRYYKLRTTLEGFWEERFHAFYRCGELSEALGHPWHDSMRWFVQAFEHAARVEPLIKIAEHYRDDNWLLCYAFVNLACELPYPEQCILFVDKHAYDYTRWHLLGIAGWYAGFYERGKGGCEKAIAHSSDKVDIDNLKWYEGRLGDGV